MTDELNTEDELEDIDDEDASLGDDVLDEVADEVDDVADEPEGFGHIDEKDVAEVPEKEDDEEEDEDEALLEEDAEDVDFDLFDDVDEL
jgi:rRNA-processing protein EBP2